MRSPLRILILSGLSAASIAMPALLAAQAPSSLIMGVRLSRPELVRSAIADGADPNARVNDPVGGNAISVAFVGVNGMGLLGRRDRPDPERHARALQVLNVLLEKRPDVDIAFRIGPRDATPLMLAAEAGALDVVKVLLDAGANPNATNGGRYTALDFAADRAPIWSMFPAEDRVEIVRLLLAKGARTDRAGADGVRPAERAKRAGLSEIAAVIAAKGSIGVRQTASVGILAQATHAYWVDGPDTHLRRVQDPRATNRHPSLGRLVGQQADDAVISLETGETAGECDSLSPAQSGDRDAIHRCGVHRSGEAVSGECGVERNRHDARCESVKPGGEPRLRGRYLFRGRSDLPTRTLIPGQVSFVGWRQMHRRIFPCVWQQPGREHALVFGTSRARRGWKGRRRFQRLRPVHGRRGDQPWSWTGVRRRRRRARLIPGA